MDSSDVNVEFDDLSSDPGDWPSEEEIQDEVFDQELESAAVIQANSSTPEPPEPCYISILNDDVLHTVFLLLSNEEFTNACEDKPPELIVQPGLWSTSVLPSVSQTCKRWHSEVTSSPLLWNHISIPRFSADRVREHLQRSLRAPLHLYMDFESQVMKLSDKRAIYQPLMGVHMHRLVECHVFLGLGSEEYNLGLFRSLVRSSRLARVPPLKILTLERTRLPSHFSYIQPKDFAFPQGVSARTLRLIEVTPDPSWGAWRNVTKLTLRKKSLELNGRFWDVMSKCKENLEELVIGVEDVTVAGSGGTNDNDQAPALPRIALTNLKKFVYHVDTSQSQYNKLFDRLDIPQGASWELFFREMTPTDIGVLETVPVPSHNRVKLIVHKDLVELGDSAIASVKRWQRSLENQKRFLSLRSAGSGTNALGYESGIYYIDVCYFILTNIATIIPQTTTELEIDFKLWDYRLNRMEFLRPLVSRLPDIHTLALRRPKMHDPSVDKRLSRELQKDLLSALSPVTAASAPCPNLSRLQLTRFDLTEEEVLRCNPATHTSFADSLANCRTERREFGCGDVKVDLFEAYKILAGGAIQKVTFDSL